MAFSSLRRPPDSLRHLQFLAQLGCLSVCKTFVSWVQNVLATPVLRSSSKRWYSIKCSTTPLKQSTTYYRVSGWWADVGCLEGKRDTASGEGTVFCFGWNDCSKRKTQCLQNACLNLSNVWHPPSLNPKVQKCRVRRGRILRVHFGSLYYGEVFKSAAGRGCL